MEIVSTMGAGSLGQEIDLEVLVSELESHLGESVDANFHSSMVTIRLEKGGVAYTVYRTGSFQIRGAKTGELLEKAFEEFKSVLTEIGVDTSSCQFRPVTFVFMEDFECEINLESLALALGLEHIEYEPEQFPGLIYRPAQYGVTFLIFSSGKVIISGTADPKMAESAAKHLREDLFSVSGS